MKYTVERAHEGEKISTYLKRFHYSAACLAMLKRQEGSIKKNGQVAHLNYPVKEADELEIHFVEESSSEQILPVAMPLDIVYEDEDMLVVNKPSGMPVHPSRKNPDNSLANALAYYYQEKNERFTFRCINRLDRDTSGLTIIAKNPLSGAILGQMAAAKTCTSKARATENGTSRACTTELCTSKACATEPSVLKNRATETSALPPIYREYLAIADGEVEPEQGTIEAPIARQKELDVERIVNFERGDYAKTHYRVLEKRNEKSLVSLVLETGRTHQIRVHMKYLGYPLIGDYLYHPGNSDMTRQALHAHKLIVTHPITREQMEFTVEMPQDMKKAFYGE